MFNRLSETSGDERTTAGRRRVDTAALLADLRVGEAELRRLREERVP